MFMRNSSILAKVAYKSAFAFSTWLATSLCASGTPHLVFDYKTGEIYSHQQAFDQWYPASLTKLMTAYTTLRTMKSGLINLKSPVKVSKFALSQPPSKMGFPVGTTLNFDNALKIIMVKSSNDVSVAIAESVAGTQARFVDLMNENAKRLGMKNSHFVNPHGLHDDDQYTSARDMGVLAQALIKEFPQHASYFNIPAIKVGRRTMRNHNRLMHKMSGIRGMKTGFTCPSGLNVVVARDHGDKHLISVVMGHSTGRERNIKAAELLAKADEQKPMVELGTFENFYPKQMVNSAPNLRPVVCKKNKKRLTLKGRDRFMRLFSWASIEEKEQLYYDVDAPLTNVAQIGLGKATGPDPYALTRGNVDLLDFVIPLLSTLDGGMPQQPERYVAALSEIETNVVLSKANFKLHEVKNVPIPTANPERDERLAIARHSHITPQLSFVDATFPVQPGHFLQMIWNADWAPITDRKIYTMEDGTRITVPAFKADIIGNIDSDKS